MINTPYKYKETSAPTDKYIPLLADVANSITPSSLPTTTNTEKNIQQQNVTTTIDIPTVLITTYTTEKNNNEPIEKNVTAEEPKEIPINTTIQIINTPSQDTSKQVDLTKIKLKNKTKTTDIINNKNRINNILLNTVQKNTKKQKKVNYY